MKVRTKLTLYSILLIALAVAVACIMVFSFAKESALQNAFDSGVADYEQFCNAVRNTGASIPNASEISSKSYIKYVLGSIYGSWEYALQTEEDTISNNTGIDAYPFLTHSGKSVAGGTGIKHGYLSMDKRSYLVIGGAASIGGEALHLSLVRDITAVSTQINALAVRCLLLCVMLFALAALCMTLVVRGTLKPLSVLQAGALRIASGRYDAYIHIKGENEFSELAESYNEMARAVDDRIKEIERTSEDRKLLLSALSHEMRTPVTAISAYAHALSHVNMTEDQQQEAIAYINDECLRLERLSSKLMQLISLNNQAALDFQIVPTKQLVQSLSPAISPVADENGIEIVYDGPSQTQYHIELDLMICLIANLFDNARKAGASRVEIGFYENEITVSDNGCGIPKERIAAITEPFYQLDPSRSAEGFGLGLALVKRIAEAHHAALVIESQVSKGTVVRVRF